ncbi:HAD-IIB family hydrolase [Bradyrhizobium sp. 149]|uniref:HAD-IIB family hydrolase n=1 Tax=Bradyrhizobium sp. 149 TaxID=2782624 RepID=UPI001FFA28A9|nr:HAD-IIB family hydrolase [Bradyrhizobium sp. 149]MCK1650176.1 HAD-IIB family hydrolase [Bradyrhizobium sp. 149]
MTPYEEELSKLQTSLNRSASAELTKLKSAIAGASQFSLIAVGSGGSFTVASLLCSLHEAYTGRVSRSITPLELICNPTLAATSPIFIISAEGKNPDILEALKRAREHSSRAVHVITNRHSSPLMELAATLNDVTSHVFELSDKDGYLATNSLILDASLVARAFSELDRQKPASLDLQNIYYSGQPLDKFLYTAKEFVTRTANKRGLIIVFSPKLRPIAEDLESKFSESALLFSQLADFRSFAHGRHLWLTERTRDCALLVLTEPSTEALWLDMKPQIPDAVPIFTIPMPGSTPNDLIAGLVAGMHLVSRIANEAKRNIAKPNVSPLGRQLYYAELSSLIPPPQETGIRGEQSKYEVLGAHWPSPRNSGKIRRALEEIEQEFSTRDFRAIVFDYDGTLCSSNKVDLPPGSEILQHLNRITKAGMIVGIASGRGDSVRDHLRDTVDKGLWPMFRLALYNGGWIGALSDEIQRVTELSEFLIHAKRIVLNLRSQGVPISRIRANAPHQLSIRFENGVSADNMWFVIADALKQAGLESGTVLKSKHSVDILSRGVSKSHIVAHIVQTHRMDPYEVVTMGDLGAWPGNDSSLLQHRFSLSVDLPSRRIDRGWKLAPRYKRDLDATLWYLDRLKLNNDQTFRFDFLENDVERR